MPIKVFKVLTASSKLLVKKNRVGVDDNNEFGAEMKWRYSNVQLGVDTLAGL